MSPGFVALKRLQCLSRLARVGRWSAAVCAVVSRREMHLLDAEEAVGAEAQGGGEVFGVLGCVAQVELARRGSSRRRR